MAQQIITLYKRGDQELKAYTTQNPLSALLSVVPSAAVFTSVGQQVSHPLAQTVITTSSQIATLSSTQPVANTSTHPVTNTSTQLHLSTQPVISTSPPIMTLPSIQPVTNTSTHLMTHTSTQPHSSTQRVMIPSTPIMPQNSTNLHASSQPVINTSEAQPLIHPLTQTIGPPPSQPLPRPCANPGYYILTLLGCCHLSVSVCYGCQQTLKINGQQPPSPFDDGNILRIDREYQRWAMHTFMPICLAYDLDSPSSFHSCCKFGRDCTGS